MLKILLPILTVVGAIFLGKYLIATGPEAKKKPFVQRFPVVEVQVIKPENYRITLKASGVVRAGIQTNLVAEVSGKITKVSDKFLEGSYFKKGETLLSIDPSNYRNSLAIVESDVAANRASLNQINEEEKSTKRSYNLARNNLNLGKKELARLRNLWKRKVIARSAVDAEEQKLNQLQQRLEDALGRLNTYKSRKLAIQAKINASLSRVKQERLNITRTKIKAHYAGRVLKRNVDTDQFVATGTKLGKIYATSYVYVDLPLSLNQYDLLGIAEQFEDTQSNSRKLPEVVFTSTNSHTKSTWHGKVVRTSAALNVDSRQINVIAKINSPFKLQKGVTTPLRIGQYLNAKIDGKLFRGVYILPSGAVRQNKEILLLKQGKVHIVPVNVVFNTSAETIVTTAESIEDQQLITTNLSQAVEGTVVITVAERNRQQKEKDKKKKKSEENNKNGEKQTHHTLILDSLVS